MLKGPHVQAYCYNTFWFLPFLNQLTNERKQKENLICFCLIERVDWLKEWLIAASLQLISLIDKPALLVMGFRPNQLLHQSHSFTLISLIKERNKERLRLAGSGARGKEEWPKLMKQRLMKSNGAKFSCGRGPPAITHLISQNKPASNKLTPFHTSFRSFICFACFER